MRVIDTQAGRPTPNPALSGLIGKVELRVTGPLIGRTPALHRYERQMKSRVPTVLLIEIQEVICALVHTQYKLTKSSLEHFKAHKCMRVHAQRVNHGSMTLKPARG